MIVLFFWLSRSHLNREWFLSILQSTFCFAFQTLCTWISHCPRARSACTKILCWEPASFSRSFCFYITAQTNKARRSIFHIISANLPSYSLRWPKRLGLAPMMDLSRQRSYGTLSGRTPEFFNNAFNNFKDLQERVWTPLGTILGLKWYIILVVVAVP